MPHAGKLPVVPLPNGIARLDWRVAHHDHSGLLRGMSLLLRCCSWNRGEYPKRLALGDILLPFGQPCLLSVDGLTSLEV